MTEDTNAPVAKPEIVLERVGNAGLITLNRPKALNALSLQMVRDLSAALIAWRDDPEVMLVAIRGSNKIGRPGSKEALFGGFCAGGDIRFFHQAALSRDSTLEDFFTEEYSLNYLIQNYPKPYIAFMDGVVMGGGMGLSQGAAMRLVTEHTKMAMPETNIGLFPDVGGGYFLSQCPGSVGEYLALTGEVIGADEAISYQLADVKCPAADMPALWAKLGQQSFASIDAAKAWVANDFVQGEDIEEYETEGLNAYFSLLRVKHIVDALEASKQPWARKLGVVLRKRSPLMLHVTLEQIRKARGLPLADVLRMERDMVYQCFHLRPGADSETVEGIRALAIDKDYSPRWSPERIEDIKPGMADEFFVSPWTAETHPLRGL
ncbi:putative enoyl-CoA hydratase echA8 [Polaromonas vacuolata]|uniref:Putative enoyl-CoA hydratase echA8 n=1 Tax=Polaromonas vacuolata TaxID=37448 RepID=A0A6H2H951_9BURK|nr:enoyl-CoA hydratase/isomerase family protein [Polaromonas vacuolata]QJC56399.1 putative enoyl-CoA hydratase echA8 [Polaromonas vacuolata]